MEHTTAIPTKTDEHRINPPLPGSYQALSRTAFKSRDILCHTADDARKLDHAKDDIDFLAWKADHQVKALKDKIEYLEGLLQGAQII